jgi:hypothetical protein
MNGKTLADLYKNQLSGYRDWEGMKRLEGSSSCYIVFPENCGKWLSIDETALSRDQVFTFVTNKACHGGKGTLVAMISGPRHQPRLLRHLLKAASNHRVGVRFELF